MEILLSNWHYYVEDNQFSTEEFYEVLADDFLRHKIPSASIVKRRYFEGNVFSPKRKYLTVIRDGHFFEVCAAPFGTGYFFSWWLFRRLGCLPEIMLMIPFVGKHLVRFFWPVTFYNIDTALMFQEAVRTCVNRVINQFLQVQGCRQLSELEEKPIIQDIFKR